MPLLHHIKSGDLSPHSFGDIELTHCYCKHSTAEKAERATKKYEAAVETHDALPKKGGGRAASRKKLGVLKKAAGEAGEAHTALTERQKTWPSKKKGKKKAAKRKPAKKKATKKGKKKAAKRKPAKGKRKAAKRKTGKGKKTGRGKKK